MFSLVFSGNLGSEPSFAYGKDGTPYARLSVAVYNGKDEKPLWVRVTVFGKPAEIFAAGVPAKGQRVLVQGDRPFQVSLYEKRGGGMDYSVDFKATWVELQGVSVSAGKSTK